MSANNIPDFFADLDIAEKQPATKKITPLKQSSLEQPDFFSEIEEADLSKAQMQKPMSLKTPEEETPDFYDMIEPEAKELPKKTLFEKFRPEEKTPEELKSMSAKERLEYSKELSQFRELQQSRGFTKGALSGLTLSASEYIPGLKPNEEDLMVGLGEAVGSYLPISSLYNFIGKPLVQLAAKSPVAKSGLKALARITGFGATGAGTKVIKGFIQGERPTPQELLKEGATWAAIDAGLQALGLGVSFSGAVRNIAEKEGVPAKDVLSRLWNSTKNFLKKKFIKPENIGEPEIEVLMREAEKAQANGFPKEIEIEVSPKEIESPKAVIEPEVKPIEFKEKTQTEVEKAGELQSFTTSKGSSYEINPDGSTTRVKAARPEHPEEAGLQPKSEKTWFITPEDSLKLGEIQTEGENKKIVELPNGQLGVQYISGKDKDKIEKRTLVDFSKQPEEGLIPVEAWDEGKRIHFGTPIVKIEKPTPVEAKPKPAQLRYTREDFPTKEEAQQYLEHLQKSLVKATETHIAGLKSDIKNIQKIISEFEKEAAPRTEKRETEEVVPESLASKTASKKTQIPPKQTRPRQPSVMGKKQAVARSKILERFRKVFNDPIRLGKLGKRKASGIHKLWPKVTRLLKDNDVETAAHEIGHNLHTTLYEGNATTPEEQAKNINAALRPYLNELKPLASYEPWGMEGFAEFIRLYVTNSDVARELAPKFYEKFENDLDAQFPEMKNALLEARQYYEDYLQGTPQSRIRAQTSYAEDKGKLANIIEATKKYLDPDFLKTEFLDDVFPAKRLVAEAFGIPLSEVENLKDERNLYRALRVLKGAVGKGDVFVLHETFNAKTLDKINGSLRDILKQLPDEDAYKELNDYLIARRAIEKAGQNIDTGINVGDAVVVEADLRSKYGKLAKELDKYNDSLLKYAKDSGLLSDEQYAMIKNNNILYAPFQRVMEAEKGGRLGCREIASRQAY